MSPKSLTMRLDYTGLTVYMTRQALQELAAHLTRISEAPPEECFDVHLRMAFSEFDTEDNFVSPPLKSSGPLKSILEELHRNAVEQAIESGDVPPDALPSPFELTFMHVSPQAVLEEAARPEDETENPEDFIR